MLAVAGYYDGTRVCFLEKPRIKKNQRLMITVMDDFIDEETGDAKPAADRRNAAFQRLEAWRERNKDSWGDGFDWRREAEEAIREKYGFRKTSAQIIS